MPGQTSLKHFFLDIDRGQAFFILEKPDSPDITAILVDFVNFHHNSLAGDERLEIFERVHAKFLMEFRRVNSLKSHTPLWALIRLKLNRITISHTENFSSN